MTRKELEKFIDDEVAKLTEAPLTEPIKEVPKSPVVPPSKPVLNDETEIDEYLFRAGMKEK